MPQAGALLVSVPQNRTRSLNEEFSQIAVATLADAEKLLLASGGVFAGNQSEPGCELPTLAETSPFLQKSSVRPRGTPLRALDRFVAIYRIEEQVREMPPELRRLIRFRTTLSGSFSSSESGDRSDLVANRSTIFRQARAQGHKKMVYQA